MKRKIIATVIATLLLAGLLPASAAFASGSATASLAAANRDVLPGPGKQFSLTVTNTDVTSPVSGLTGARINYVSIILPGSRGFRIGGEVPVPDGWELITIDEGTSQELIYRRDSGGIAPASSQTFNFPVNVLAPPDSDRVGRFTVGVSNNGGETVSIAEPASPGALDSLVRILEVLNGTVTAPPLAANGTASAGQAVTYGVTVKNHAQNMVTVTPSLTANTAGDQITSEPNPAGVGGNGGQHTFPFGVTFNPNRSSDGASSFTAGATAASSEARSAIFSYTVQVPPFLQFHEDTFRPRAVQPESSDPGDPLTYVFRADFTKRNNPTLTLLVGDATGTSTLSFADTEVELAAGQQFGGAGDRQEVASRSTSVQGEDGDYHVDYDITARDGNGFEFPLDIRSNNAILSIDALAPVIDNLQTLLPNSQTHAKNGDEIRVTGEVKDRTAQPDGLTVVLEEIGRQTIEPTSVSTSMTADGYTFDARFHPDFIGDTGDFQAFVEAVDDAGNTGSETGELLGIDNIVPFVADTGFYVTHPVTNEVVIQFVFVENNLVLGACDERLYRVTGQLAEIGVRDVQYSDGSECRPGEAGPQGEGKTPTNMRLLVLQSPPSQEDRDAATNVEYDPTRLLVQDGARDGANNVACTENPPCLQDIFARIVPPLPSLSDFKRNNGEEDAVFDEDVYWTRFPGNDFTLVVGNAVSSERVEVVDQNGNVVATAPWDGGNGITTTVPVGSTDGTFRRGIRLANMSQNLRGPIEWIDITLDRAAPTIASATRISDDEVAVTFSEVVWAGSNAAANWRAFEDDQGGDGLARMAVTSAGGEREQRTLAVNFQDTGPFAGVEYRLITGDRYEDRAGNFMPSPLFQGA